MLCFLSYLLLAFCNTGRYVDAGIFDSVNKGIQQVNLYFISGLGVDERVFQKLKLSSGFTIHYLQWMAHLKGESITSYAKRLSLGIDQSRPFALVGLSFGGMLASEINGFMQPAKTVIISSAANNSELPWYIRCIRFVPLYKLLPGWLILKPNSVLYHVMGVKTKEEKALFRQLLADTNIELLKWSIHAITNWHGSNNPVNLIHIHGDADKLLPIKFTNTNYIINGGGHFMIYSKAEEISELLNRLLE